ncbi:MAG: DUF4124 domain-containing protein [Rhodanobacteraceae bacterium]
MRDLLSRASIALALCLCWSLAAAGQDANHNRYKWRDGQGNLHYSDSLPADAAVRGYDVLSADGILIKHVDRAQSPAERAAARAALAKSRATTEDAENRVRADQQLLVAYPEEGDLVQSQRQQLDLLDRGIKSAQLDLTNAEANLSDLLDHAATFDRDGKPVPADIVRKIAEMRQRTRVERDTVARQQNEREQTQRKFADDLAHYRQLKAARVQRQD